MTCTVDNNYLDTSVQKAFLPGVPGCLEQYRKLCAIICDAHAKHRSLSRSIGMLQQVVRSLVIHDDEYHYFNYEYH